MKHWILALLIPTAAFAGGECVLNDRTVTASTVQIQERSGLARNVVPAPDGGRRCMVNFKARIGDQWYWANGHYDWPGDRSSDEACAVAVSRAEDAVKMQVAPSTVRSEKVMICSDRDDLSTMRQATPGTVAKLHQFRPHPNFPKAFMHNGTQCRWFVEPTFTGQDIRQYQGVICQVQNNDWVVVDKF